MTTLEINMTTNQNSGGVTFYCNEMGILSINLVILILITILMKMILILLFLSDFWLCILNSKNAIHLKKEVKN